MISLTLGVFFGLRHCWMRTFEEGGGISKSQLDIKQIITFDELLVKKKPHLISKIIRKHWGFRLSKHLHVCKYMLASFPPTDSQFFIPWCRGCWEGLAKETSRITIEDITIVSTTEEVFTMPEWSQSPKPLPPS